MTDLTLDSLFSDTGPFDETEVVRVLAPLLTIQRDTNLIYFTGTDISAECRLLAYMLAKKLLKHHGKIENEQTEAREYRDATGTKKGTFDPTLSKLKAGGYVIGEQAYEIPLTKLPGVLKILAGKEIKK